MEMSLGFKLKLGFARGDFPKPSDPYKLARWKRCNSAAHSSIMHSVSKEIGATIIHSRDCVHAWKVLQSRLGGSIRPTSYALRKEINSLAQGDMTISAYHERLLYLWSEESLQSFDSCDLGVGCNCTRCMERKLNESKIMQFLMGLNDIHAQKRTRILQMRPISI